MQIAMSISIIIIIFPKTLKYNNYETYIMYFTNIFLFFVTVMLWNRECIKLYIFNIKSKSLKKNKLFIDYVIIKLLLHT